MYVHVSIRVHLSMRVHTFMCSSRMTHDKPSARTCLDGLSWTVMSTHKCLQSMTCDNSHMHASGDIVLYLHTMQQRIHVHIHVHIHIHTRERKRTYIRARPRARTYTQAHTHSHIRTHIHMHIHIDIHMHTCIRTYTYARCKGTHNSIQADIVGFITVESAVRNPR
jgi:hypothetical protein